ncbi:unannotated protein [freshwater metagenome]|uniref:Unannotated protein n=1 Tax=freshwater metagenome TaxID=449393 RepID=A0A6J7HL49_9ZZZZ|nr:hypothetical protein [Actinomycetota bacterium]
MVVTVVLGTYTAPEADVVAGLPAHLVFLEELLADGRLLTGGRNVPGDGSVLVLHGVEPNDALAVLAPDPYVTSGVVRYEVAGAFLPGMLAPGLAEVLGDAS